MSLLPPRMSHVWKGINLDLAEVLVSPQSHTVLCESAAQIVVDRDQTEVVTSEDPSSYYYEQLKQPERSFAESHAIFGTLKGQDLIERYNVYRRVNVDQKGNPTPYQNSPMGEEIAVADIRVGKDLNGHTDIVHGGIISLLIDDTFGWGYEAMVNRNGKSYGDEDVPIVVTANLNVDFRNPLPANSNFVIRIFHEKTDRRKLYFRARIESHDGSVLYCEAKSLFIMLKKK